MTDRERIGAALLIGLFVLMGVLLWFTMARPAGEGRSIENNLLIEQRMKNRNQN